MSTQSRFWETLELDQLSDSQWESLCDGCGRCCLQKLEDQDTGEIVYTRVACRLLDDATARCSNYTARFDHVPDCLSVRPLTDEKSHWLPKSCAYRRLYEGRGLADWHPLISGTAESVIDAGISVVGKTRAESEVPLAEWPNYVIDLNDFVVALHKHRKA